ncbi:DUF5979 domain-containing protein [Corynebacterium durum]|uniref:DUF5979 domain-containing protein n=1 Tax=Corynebacterium durum TaxID=61592 RepID=UPI0028EC7398|nr:DUF5979 domain-containing protein [Corynebacterium durum]
MGRSLSLRIYAIVSTVCLILTSVLIHQPIAHAGTITISNVRVESDNLPIKQYSQVDVKWDWYAGNVADGQKFSVAFPEVLSLKANQGIELKDKDNEVGGTCDADNNTRTVTCTFNDRFSAKDDVRGTFSIKVQASKAQKSKDVTFQVDGAPKVVRLPGDDGQDGIIGADVHVPKTFKKEGWAEDDKVHARWTITIPGSELVQHAPNQDAIIDDELSLKAGDVGHKFIEGYGAYAREFTADQVDNPREKGIAITYNQAIQEERKQVITVKRPNGGWKADRFYQVSYMSIATDGKIPTKATDIANKARLRGTALEVSDIASFAQDASGTITGVDRGTFELRKVIDSGTLPSPALENDAKFTVKVTIDSDDDSFDETYEVQVPANGDVVQGKKKLPAGTRVTLEEVIPANSPVTFDAPKFTATNPSDAGQLTGGSPSVTLTTVEDRNIGVTLTNTLTPPTSGFFFDKAIAIMTEDGANVAEGKDAEIAELKKRLPEFTVHYTCAAGDKNYDGEVKIKSDGTPSQPVSNIPVGAQCRFIEEDVEAVGYRWHYHIRKNDHGDVLPTRAETPNVFDYTVTNERQHLRVTNKFIPTKNPVGKFKIVKTVEDPHKVIPPNEKKRYVFEYRCVPDRPKGPPSQPRQQVPQADDANEPAPVQFTLTVDGAGEVTSPEIPVGYVCSITERASSADVKDATRTTSITPESVKISADQVQTFTVNNVYASDLGDFTITKKLDNPDNVAVGDKDFTFHYVCMDKNRTEATKVEGDLVVKANGTATSKKIPHDFNCVVNEVGADVAGADLKTSGLEEVTIVKGATKSVTATNTYTALKGSVKVTKELAGSAKDLDVVKHKTFTVGYVCTKEGKETSKGEVKLKVDEPATIKDIVVGSRCTFTEDTKDVAVDGAIFVEDESIVRAEATVEDERSEASARIKNSYNNLGTVEITKEVVGLVAGSSSNKSKEYQFTATWGIGNESKKETFTLKDGDTHKLPQMPVGTMVTLRETMPASDTFTSWATPRFGSDTAGAVKDNGDGTATITVKAESSKATVVKVTNSANIPWWWFVIPIVPLIPLPTPPAPSVQKPPAPLSATPTPSVPAPKTCDPHVPASGTPGEPGGYSGGHGANGTDKGVPCVPQKGIPAKAQSGNPTPEKQNPRNLANTGASVIGVSVLALLVVTAGAVMIIRSRRS